MKMNYVVGFVFNDDLSEVLLIRKNKPKWQVGKLNAVGGKIEKVDKSPLHAMIREFAEEVGNHSGVDWNEFCHMTGTGFEIHWFFAQAKQNLHTYTSNEDEKVEVVSLADISVMPTSNMIENLPWLLGAAIDHINDGRPAYLNVVYP